MSGRGFTNRSPEELLYVACARAGAARPDFLAVVDAEEGRIVAEAPMPNVGDELRRFGWNRVGRGRSHLIVPGLRSSRIHVVNVADDPRRPWIERVIEPDEVVRKTGYTRPHAVHCVPGDKVVVSMLGDAEGACEGGFALLDASSFELEGRWESDGDLPPLNGDSSLQPCRHVLVSSELAAPNTYETGFDLADLVAGRYGSSLHFWNLAERRLEQILELGERGLLPLAVRMLHDPDAEEGFAAAALSGTVWHLHRHHGSWRAERVITVDPVELAGWPFPVPALISDLVLSMDDRSLYCSSWLHGDLRQYDVSDAASPRLTATLHLGGVLGRASDAGRPLDGGPLMLQLSLDGRRLYVTNSLYCTWDNQFHPGLRSWLLRVNCHQPGMEVDRDFLVDLHARADGPARAREVRLANGDCTTEIFE